MDRARPANVPADDDVGSASNVGAVPSGLAIGSGSRVRLVGSTLDLLFELAHAAREGVVSSHFLHLLQGRQRNRCSLVVFETPTHSERNAEKK